MARLHIPKAYATLSEGTHNFKVDAVEYNEEFGKIILKLTTTDSNEHHQERFDISKEKTMSFFGFVARTILGDQNIEDFDTEDLVGKIFSAECTHTKTDNGKTFANLSNYAEATSYTVDLDDLDDLLD